MLCCPLDDGEGESAKFSIMIKPTARKRHKCYECEDVIFVGETYVIIKGVWDYSWSTYKFCIACQEIRNHFECGGFSIFGSLWEELQSNLFPYMPAGGECTKGLSSIAMHKLFNRCLDWQERGGKRDLTMRENYKEIDDD